VVRITVIHKNHTLTASTSVTVDVSPLMDSVPARATLWTLVNAEKSIVAK
jgi:hypothetical protein